MTPFLRKILGMNWVLVFLMYGLLVFGVFMIESAARHLAVPREVLNQYGSAGAYYAAMQKQWILVGSVVYFAVALVDYRWIRWLGLPFYVAGLALMAMAIMEGDSVHRLTVAGFKFQPAQMGVSSGIILIAWLLQDLPKLHRFFGSPFMRIAIIGGVAAPPFLMMMKMGDMGSALVWIPVAVVALLVGGAPFRYLSFMGFVAAGLLPLLYLRGTADGFRTRTGTHRHMAAHDPRHGGGHQGGGIRTASYLDGRRQGGLEGRRLESHR